MYKIFARRHPRLTIPTLDFAGVPVGLDALCVVDSNRPPVINTGIAHREAGVGQIGAGICNAPLEPFKLGLHQVWNSLPSKSGLAVRALKFLKK